MSYGLPVVATDVGGTREAVRDGVTGKLVPPGNPERMAQAMIEYLRDPKLRSRAGTEARRRVEACFSVDRLVRTHEQLYEECLREAQCKPVADRAGRELQYAGA
jgi:glycosyltransferase involved in cell wall biosynthesis